MWHKDLVRSRKSRSSRPKRFCFSAARLSIEKEVQVLTRPSALLLDYCSMVSDMDGNTNRESKSISILCQELNGRLLLSCRIVMAYVLSDNGLFDDTDQKLSLTRSK